MTDRIATLTVILDDEYRVDDAEHIINAISMTKGVHKVVKGEVCDANHYMNKATVGFEIKQAVNKAIDDAFSD